MTIKLIPGTPGTPAIPAVPATPDTFSVTLTREQAWFIYHTANAAEPALKAFHREYFVNGYGRGGNDPISEAAFVALSSKVWFSLFGALDGPLNYLGLNNKTGPNPK